MTAWLLERVHKHTKMMSGWLCFNSLAHPRGQLYFNTDPSCAVRFSRPEDAAALAHFFDIDPEYDLRPTEHMWEDPKHGSKK